LPQGSPYFIEQVLKILKQKPCQETWFFFRPLFFRNCPRKTSR